MNPKGKLIIIGGAVDTGSFSESNFEIEVEKNLNFFETGILRKIILESRYKEQSRIEIITTASLVPREVGPEYLRAFEYLGAVNVDVLHIENRSQAMFETSIER